MNYDEFLFKLGVHLDLDLPHESTSASLRLTEDLGFDSLVHFEILMFLEDELQTVIGYEVIEQIGTLGDVFTVYSSPTSSTP